MIVPHPIPARKIIFILVALNAGVASCGLVESKKMPLAPKPGETSNDNAKETSGDVKKDGKSTSTNSVNYPAGDGGTDPFPKVPKTDGKSPSTNSVSYPAGDGGPDPFPKVLKSVPILRYSARAASDSRPASPAFELEGGVLRSPTTEREVSYAVKGEGIREYRYLHTRSKDLDCHAADLGPWKPVGEKLSLTGLADGFHRVCIKVKASDNTTATAGDGWDVYSEDMKRFPVRVAVVKNAENVFGKDEVRKIIPAADGVVAVSLGNIMKLDFSGKILWEKMFVKSSDNTHSTAAVDESTGDVYVAGFTNRETLGEPRVQKPRFFFIKYSGAGQYKWHKFYESADSIPQQPSLLAKKGTVFLAFGHSRDQFLASDMANAYKNLTLKKLTAAGEETWSQQITVGAQATLESWSLENSGNILAAVSSRFTKYRDNGTTNLDYYDYKASIFGISSEAGAITKSHVLEEFRVTHGWRALRIAGILPTKDGGYFTSWMRASDFYKPSESYVSRFDAEGAQRWKASLFPAGSPAHHNGMLNSLVLSADEKTIYAGGSNSIFERYETSAVLNVGQMALGSFSAEDGKVNWFKLFGGGKGDSLSSVSLDASGTLWMSGYHEDDSRNDNGVILKLENPSVTAVAVKMSP